MPFVAALLQTTALLTLDAREGPACGGGGSGVEDIVVCARSATARTVMPVRIDGRPATLLIEPAGDDDMVCNTDFIARAGIATRRDVYLARVGAVDVRAGSATVDVALPDGAPPRRLRAVWPAGRAVRTADCKIGPNALGGGAIRFILGEARANAVTTVFPRDPTRDDVYARLRYGEHRVQVRFELDYPTTVLTANATRALARTAGGSVTGPVEVMPILYGVERDVRRIVTRTPLMVGGMTLARPYARVDDYGNANGVRSIDPGTIAGDDILVTNRPPRIGGTRLVRVGRDDLMTCVSLTIAEREITLVC